MGQSSVLLAALIGLICALIVVVSMRFRKEGRGLKSLVGVVAWLIGFGLAQQAIHQRFDREQREAERPAAPADGPVTFDLGKTASIGGVGLTADGRTAFTIAASGVLKVWETATGKELWKLETRGVGTAVFSPHGRLLAVSAAGHKPARTLQVFDALSGTLLATLSGKPAGDWVVDDMVFSHGGTHLLVSSNMLDAALYALGDLDDRPVSAKASLPRTLEPVIVPREVKLTNYWPHRFPLIGFTADDRSIYILGRDRSWLERWSNEAEPRLLSSIRFADSTRLSPNGIAADGRLAFQCDLRSLRLAPADGASSSEVLHIGIPVELPPGSYSPSIHCAVSPDLGLIVAGASETNHPNRFFYTLNMWRTDGTFVMADSDPGQPTAGGSKIPQVGRLDFTPDSAQLYVVDDLMRLHVYALRPSVKVAVIPAEATGFAGIYSGSPLLVTSNHGVLLSYHGASKAVWVPPLAPP